MSLRFGRMLVAAVIGVGCLSNVGSAQFDDLIQKVPSSANTLFIVNVDKILASPAAETGKWKSKVDEAYAAGVTILPPDATQAVMAAHFDLEALTSLWETAIIKLSDEPSLKLVAKMTRGVVGKLEGLNVVALPGDAYLVQFAPNLVAAMSPANRQTTGRWLRDIKTRGDSGLSPYLKEAYSYANELGTPVILALDLDNVASPEQIREALSHNEVVKKEKLDIDKAVAILSTLRGVTLGITFGKAPFGKIKVDFQDDLTIDAELAKKLFIYALARRGAMIDEFNDWKPNVKGKHFTMEGALGKSGMRRLFSIFDRPPVLPKKADETAPAPMPTQTSPDRAEIQATKGYIKHISDMLDDLHDKPKEYPNYTVGQTGVWYRTYAQKIERLPTMYVDPEVVDFSTKTSDNLRDASDAITNGAANSRIRQVNAPRQYSNYQRTQVYGFGYRGGWYGGGTVPLGMTQNFSVEDTVGEQMERTKIRTEERVTSMNKARTLVDQAESDLADIRKKMTAKYKEQF